MSQKERERIPVMKEVDKHELKLVEAAEVLGVGYRQTRRIWRRYWQKAMQGWCIALEAGRGQGVSRGGVVGIVRDRYPDFGPTLAAEYLAEEHGLLGRSISPA